MSTWPAEKLHPWLEALNAGHVTAAPAEGVYGYCADPFNEAALTHLMALKQRSPNKGLIVLIPNISHLPTLCPTPLPETCTQAIEEHWARPPTTDHRPTTLILPALPTLPKLLTGEHGTLAIRLPHTDYMQNYLQAWGKPLVSTSMNISGEPPANSEESSLNIAPKTMQVLTLPTPLAGQPSRIYNPTTGQWLR